MLTKQGDTALSKQLIFRVVAIFSLIGLLNGLSWANPKLFNSIRQICAAYQIDVNSSEMNLGQRSDGRQELTILINSSRNNFDRAMLIGFYAAGKAIKYFQLNVDVVTIVVNTEYKTDTNIYASSELDKVMSFVDGAVSSSEFIRKLKFS